MGGKIKKIWGYLLLLMLISAASENIYGAETPFSITQTEAYMPDLTVYLRTEQKKPINMSSIKAAIKETNMELTVEDVNKMSHTGKGIRYYILLDVSTSIKPQQFEKMKQSVIRLAENLQKKDRMQVITFGQDVKKILRGEENIDEVKDKINTIKQEKKTYLYKGIRRLAVEAEKDKDKEISEELTGRERRRNVGIILTDWQEIKDSGGVTSQEESLLMLQKEGIPLYGYCFDTVKDKIQDNMGVFLRKTGGQFHLFTEENSQESLLKLHTILLNEDVVYLKSSSNKTYEDKKVLEITSEDYAAKKDNVYLIEAEKDEISPKIEKVEQKGKEDKTLVIYFSEDVKNADNKGNYSILMNEKQVYTVSEATYTAGNGKYKAILVLNDVLAKGRYKIETSNILDNTNEENPLSDSWTGELNGEGIWKTLYKKLGRFWAIILAAVVFAIIGIIYFILKKNNGIMVMEDKMVLGSHLEKKQHVKHDVNSTKDVVLLINGIVSEHKQIPVRISGSAIVGRSSICDIYFDDLSMSRQHFVLEVDNHIVYVADLESRNGTFINGKEITGRTKVENGSVIEAGSAVITIRW